MNDQVAQVLTLFLYLLIAAIIIRSLLSWFPNAQNNSFGRLMVQITEPLLEPVRRFMPRTMMIDLSPMLVIVVLYVMISVVNQAASR